MIIGIPKETFPDENRVAIVPGDLPALTKAGVEVLIESGAGVGSGHPDSEYKEKGATISATREEVFEQAKAILQVRGLGANPDNVAADLSLARKGHIFICMSEPLAAPEPSRDLAEKGATAFSMEMIPRTTRAQSMDVLSSQATILGYKAALLAADHMPRMFPMSMTAAGTIKPVKVFVVGCGVMGLQVIATCRRLGAVVQAYDIRAAAGEEAKSLGAKFVSMELDTGDSQAKGGYAREMGEEFLKKQREMMMRVVADNDVVVTTAAVPGKKSPVLVTEEMVQGMKPGSLVLDMAAEKGGNCALTQPGETVEIHGVSIMGPINLASTVPVHASQMYSRNITTFLLNMMKDGKFEINLEDDIVRGTLIVNERIVVHGRVRQSLGLDPIEDPTPSSQPTEEAEGGDHKTEASAE